MELVLLAIIIMAALVLFVTNWVSVDLTAILVMVALMLTGILTPDQALAGFSNTATITILALLIISESLKNTGAVEELGNKMLMITGQNRILTLIVIMLIAAVTSAFINNTAVVAVFIPIVYRISQSTGIKVSALLIPLSFASMVGGASTMIGTSTNLLINSLAKENGLAGFKLFDPAIVGVILLGFTLLYLVFASSKLLNKGKSKDPYDNQVDDKRYVTEIEIDDGSELVEQSLDEIGMFSPSDVELFRINRTGGVLINPDFDTKLKAGDVLILRTNVSQIAKLNADPKVQIRTNKYSRRLNQEDEETELFEVLVSANSELIDEKISDVEFFRYDASPIAVKSKKRLTPTRLSEHKIDYGDIMLMTGKSHEQDEKKRNAWITLQRFSRNQLISQLPRRDKMLMSSLITVGAVMLAVLNIIPIIISAWLGVALLILTRCITLEKAYTNVEWKVIFLLAGIIPLGTAIQETDADQLIASGILDLVGDASPQMVISVVFISTVLLTGIISNQATAVLLVPIALQLSGDLNVPPEALLMSILFGASTSFYTPVGYQTNAMILGPGNYTFKDFLIVGGILCLLFWALVTWLIPAFYL
jgi:di/tricarboxylate transporter